MTAFNVVRFRVKPGSEEQFLEAHRKAQMQLKGFLNGSLINTGDRTFCFVGEWRNFPSIVAGRPQMIAMLDGMRELLEDLGGGLGVTDPVSGDAVVKLRAPKAAKKKKAATRKKAGGKARKGKTTKRPARKRAAKKR
jgi:hypothetical protein